jgi:hypothetical protein
MACSHPMGASLMHAELPCRNAMLAGQRAAACCLDQPTSIAPWWIPVKINVLVGPGSLIP